MNPSLIDNERWLLVPILLLVVLLFELWFRRGSAAEVGGALAELSSSPSSSVLPPNRARMSSAWLPLLFDDLFLAPPALPLLMLGTSCMGERGGIC